MLLSKSILKPPRRQNMTILWDPLIFMATALPFLVAGSYFPNEYEVYMVVESMGGASVRDVWLGINISSGVQRHQENLTLRELIPKGDFRTDLNVDQLPHEEVFMVFLNAVADPLWWIAFNGTAVEEGRWFQEVTQSSSNILNHNIYVNISNSNESFFSLYVGTGGSTQPAWAAILNPTKDSTPQFIFNADQNTPHELPKGVSTINYIGCRKYDDFYPIHRFEDMNSLTVEACAGVCSSSPFVLMQMGYKCLCGSEKNSFAYLVQDGNVCDRTCPTSSDTCGSSDSTLVAAYKISDEEPRGIEHLSCPMFRPNFTVVENEIMISKQDILSEFTLGQFYLRGHRLSVYASGNFDSYSYSMYYSLHDCNATSKKPYINISSGTIQEYLLGELWNTTLIPIVCIWFGQAKPVLPVYQYQYLDYVSVELEICIPQTGQFFFPADYLAVIGTKHLPPGGVTNPSDKDQTPVPNLASPTADDAKQETESSTQVFSAVRNLTGGVNWGTFQNVFSRFTVESKETYTSLLTTDKLQTVTTESSTQEFSAESVSTTDLVSNNTGVSNIFQGVFSGSTIDNKETFTSVSTTERLETGSRNTGDVVSLSSELHISTSKSPSSTEISITPDYVTTILSAVSKTDLSTNRYSNMTSSSVLCTCECYQTNDNLEEKLEQIKNILKVDKKKLSSMYRKHNSAHDPRPSSRSIGATGVAVLVTFFGIIVLMDLTNLRQH